MIKIPMIQDEVVDQSSTPRYRAQAMDPRSSGVSGCEELIAQALFVELNGDVQLAVGLWNSAAVLAEDGGMNQEVFDALVKFARRVVSVVVNAPWVAP